jgi:5-methylcytosine-specific restriction endonuclease McrA
MFGFTNKFIKTTKSAYLNGWINRKTYLIIMNTYKYDGKLICEICKEKFTVLTKSKKDNITIDHIIPKSKGGTWDIKNLRITHKNCNFIKGNKL